MNKIGGVSLLEKRNKIVVLLLLSVDDVVINITAHAKSKKKKIKSTVQNRLVLQRFVDLTMWDLSYGVVIFFLKSNVLNVLLFFGELNVLLLKYKLKFFIILANFVYF